MSNTETMTTEAGTTITVTSTGTDYSTSTTIKAVRADGTVACDGSDYLVIGKLHPSYRPQVEQMISRTKLSSNGRTPEQESARVAAVDAYEQSNAATKKAMSY